VFGIDPGSARTGYGCVETDGSRHHLVACGAISSPARAALPQRLQRIHDGLGRLLARHRPDCVAIENLFHAKNVKSALVLGHARGVAVLAAVEAGVPVVEYTPAEVKLAVTGYGPRKFSCSAWSRCCSAWSARPRRTTRPMPSRWRFATRTRAAARTRRRSAACLVTFAAGGT
jgi:crossover junction endodeoxyribonuclease RuvC